MALHDLMEQIQKQKSEVSNLKSYGLLKSLFDENSFTQIDSFSIGTQEQSEVICGFGAILGRPAYAFCQDFESSGGVVSKHHITRLKKLYKLAGKAKVPIIGIYNSAGMRLLDGEELISEMGSLIKCSLDLSENIPQISVALGNCVGLNCILARSADILIATQNAEVSVDYKNTKKISKSYNNNEDIDILVENDNEALNLVRKLIDDLPSNSRSMSPIKDVREPDNSNFDGFDSVINKIYNGEIYNVKTEILNVIFDKNSFIELSYYPGQAFCTGIAKLGGITVGTVASDHINNEGFIEYCDSKKIKRFIGFCNKFHIPIISFFDSKEFISTASAIDFYNAYGMTDVIKINVVLGELYGALASAVLSDNVNQNCTVAWPSANISLLPYKSLANILYNDDLKKLSDPITDRKELFAKFREKELNPIISAEKGLISDVIDPIKTRQKLFSLLELFIPTAF